MLVEEVQGWFDVVVSIAARPPSFCFTEKKVIAEYSKNSTVQSNASKTNMLLGWVELRFILNPQPFY